MLISLENGLFKAAFLNRQVMDDFKRVVGMTIIEFFLLKVG